MADNPKLLSLLGIARPASRLGCGHDAAVDAIRSGRSALCFLSSDSSQRLRDEIAREIHLAGKDIPVSVLDSTMEEIGHATGLKSAVITVNDEGFAKAMLKLSDTEEVIE